MMTPLLPLLLFSLAWNVNAFATQPNAISSTEAQVLREWILVGDRYSSSAAAVEVDNNELIVRTTRSVAPGEVLFRLGKNAIWSDAYSDRDLGPKLRDFASKAGPGFSVVSLAGGLAADRVRRFRSREGLGVAPESAGFTVPSKWGAFARYLWSSDSQDNKSSVDESLVDVVSKGVNLLVPLLDVAARRYWTSEAADEPEASVLEEEWTRKALLNDGAPQSWSRSDLENVAFNSMGIVLKETRAPPSFLLDGTVGSLVPEPFVDKSTDPPESWPTGEGLAFVPLVNEVCRSMSKDKATLNAVIGSPPRSRHDGEDDCLWCVATRRLDAGEQVIAPDPWT